MYIIESLILDEVSVTGTAVSKVLTLARIQGFSVQGVYTGSANLAADITIEVSNDNITWTTLAAPAHIAGATGSEIIISTEAYFKLARVSISNITGTLSTIKLHAYGKL